ncbi:hypothetical protein HGQ98_33090 [Achromobacter ruhlandii]|uniref:Uncharacterized protein n=1 Tax=Achromobacter ruhlandii TaxID=72557 RepID=A0A848NLH6_9BURK|nr:hypothetical protein [Achromobacter ruhlandii]
MGRGETGSRRKWGGRGGGGNVGEGGGGMGGGGELGAAGVGRGGREAVGGVWCGGGVGWAGGCGG